MAETEQKNGDEITIPLPWGHPLVARGSMVILVLLIMAGGYASYVWNIERAKEHDEIQRQIGYQACLQKLAIYVATARDPTHIALNTMPAELWGCLPKFLGEAAQEERKQSGR